MDDGSYLPIRVGDEKHEASSEERPFEPLWCFYRSQEDWRVDGDFLTELAPPGLARKTVTTINRDQTGPHQRTKNPVHSA